MFNLVISWAWCSDSDIRVYPMSETLGYRTPISEVYPISEAPISDKTPISEVATIQMVQYQC